MVNSYINITAIYKEAFKCNKEARGFQATCLLERRRASSRSTLSVLRTATVHAH